MLGNWRENGGKQGGSYDPKKDGKSLDHEWTTRQYFGISSKWEYFGKGAWWLLGPGQCKCKQHNDILRKHLRSSNRRRTEADLSAGIQERVGHYERLQASDGKASYLAVREHHIWFEASSYTKWVSSDTAKFSGRQWHNERSLEKGPRLMLTLLQEHQKLFESY